MNWLSNNLDMLLLVASNLCFIISGFFLYTGNWLGVFSSAALGAFLQHKIFNEDAA